MSVSGVGNLKANGYVNHLSTSISGAGDADLQNLFAEHATVHLSGAGDAEVYASQSISVRVSGAGDVCCYGNPLYVDQHISGAGDLVLKPHNGQAEFSLGDSARNRMTISR